MIYNNITELVGNTPIIKASKYAKKHNLNDNLYLKLEKFNPSSSVKDRASLEMIHGILKKNKNAKVLIEATSGNTGIGLATFCNYYDLELIAVMPSSLNEQRKQLLASLGATLELVDGNMASAVQRANELHEEIKDSVLVKQFENEDNSNSHYLYTANEILTNLPDVDIVIMGFGTGGTISGVAKRLKEENSNIKIVGIEPKNSPIVTEGISGKHSIFGIGAGFIPDILRLDLIDEIVKVTDEDATKYAKEIMLVEGVFVGVSSGAALCVAKDYLEKYPDKKILAILPDTGERYSWN